MRGLHITAFCVGPILTDLELAFDLFDEHAEAGNAGEHCAAKAVGHVTPLLEIARFMDADQVFEQPVFSRVVFNQIQSSVGVNGDVIPSRYRKLFDIEAGRNVAVRAAKNNERFALLEKRPVGIGFGEMTFDQTVGSMILDDEGKMRGHLATGSIRRRERSEKNGK